MILFINFQKEMDMNLEDMLSGGIEDFGTKETDPREIFKNLTKKPGYGYLRNIQVEFLNCWYENREEKQFVGLLETGMGKTLISLLILMSKMNENKQPVVYLLPNNQLVAQALEQANNFGIPVTSKENMNFGGFWDGKEILITNFQTMFNGNSLFGVKNKTQTQKVGTILIDDAHKASEIALSQGTVTVSKTENMELYNQLLLLLKPSLKQQNNYKFETMQQEVRVNSLMKVPYWAIVENVEKIEELLASYVNKDDNNLNFNIPFVENHIKKSEFVVSNKAIHIRPRVVDKSVIPAFDKADYIIYLSGSLVKPADYVYGLGVTTQAIENKLDLTREEPTEGKKLILSANKIFKSNTRPEFVKLVTELDETENIVVLVPSKYDAQKWISMGFEFFEGPNVSHGVEELKNSGKAGKRFVFANRYEGMDLSGDACHVLFIDGLPKGVNDFDRYQQSLDEELSTVKKNYAQAIEQGMGRSVRDNTDYSIIVLFGEDLISKMNQIDFRNHLSSKLQLQRELSEGIVERAVLSKDKEEQCQKLKVLLSQFLKPYEFEDLQRYYAQYMDKFFANAITKIDELNAKELKKLEAMTDVYKLYSEERCQEANRLLSAKMSEGIFSQNETNVLRELKAELMYHFDTERSEEEQRKAAISNTQLLRPKNGMNNGIKSSKREDRCEKQARSIFEYVKKTYSKDVDFLNNINSALENLVFTYHNVDKNHNKFENSVEMLGKMLGFYSCRPEETDNVGPDNMWLFEDTILILESKSEATSNKGYNKSQYGQLKVSQEWGKALFPQHTIIPVAVYPTKKYTEDVKIALMNSEIRVIDFDLLEKLKTDINGLKTDLGSNFSELTVEKIKYFIKNRNVETATVIAKISESKF